MVAKTLLFTDVVDSTRLVEKLGDERAAALWAEHDRLARELLAEHGALEVDRTDGLFVLFDDVLDAARFGLRYHEALATLGIAARVGLHRGDVVLRENSRDAVSRCTPRMRCHRETSDRLSIGTTSIALANTWLDSGDARAATAALEEGEAVLRAIDNPLELGFLLCTKTRIAIALGDPDAARAALAEAEAMANRLGTATDSRLGREIATLRDALRGAG